MRSATVYQIKDTVILCSNAYTVAGVGLSIPPYIHLSKNASDEKIVSAINDVIDANQFGVPHPKQHEWGIISKKHLEGLGIKSMSAIYNKAVYCLIEENGNNLIFTPSKKEGTKGGFLHVPEMAVIVSMTSPPKQIADGLRKVLQISLAMPM